MPLMDGFEATRRIREFEKECNSHHIPILAVSAGVMDEHAMALASGMNDFISKPVATKILYKKVARYLGIDIDK